MFLTVIITVIVTLIVVIIIRNMSSLELQLEHQINPDFSVGDAQFERVMSNLMGPRVLPGNKITILKNGVKYFPDMLEAIQNAKESITLETFIYWSGSIGRKFTDALMERAEAGVRVHLLVDWLGGWDMEKDLSEKLKASKIEFRFFRKPGFHNLAVFNNRTHRKILVVDGRIAYTGGAGIADAWDGDAQDDQHWRDSQYRLEGPSVSQMQAAFMDNWIQVSQEVLLKESYFPEQPCNGSIKAQCFMSGPGSGSESARLMYLISIACAKTHIRLGQGYFVPDRLSLETLIAAKKRGVKVEIIVQGPTDAYLVKRASRNLWGKLLKHGIDLYEYRKARYHCKTMIVDDCWVSVGSTNFDSRSFRHNDEVNLTILDTEFAEREASYFDEDKTHCRPITYQEWQNRPRAQKFLDACASIFRQQM